MAGKGVPWVREVGLYAASAIGVLKIQLGELSDEVGATMPPEVQIEPAIRARMLAEVDLIGECLEALVAELQTAETAT